MSILSSDNIPIYNLVDYVDSVKFMNFVDFDDFLDSVDFDNSVTFFGLVQWIKNVASANFVKFC